MTHFLENKKIDIVGFTGNEGSSILGYLLKHNSSNITVHDFIRKDEIEKNFKIWHKGLSPVDKELEWRKFYDSLTRVSIKLDGEYLSGIENADIIFVPQSWRMYHPNRKLKEIFDSGKIPFLNLTRLYIEHSKAITIAVTGTVGKGSTSVLLSELLKTAGKKVYFGGNETWMPQVLEKIDEMNDSDYLILEVSHRQLLDGLKKGPHIGVLTNLYPNHLNEVTWSEYMLAKQTLFTGQDASDYAVINGDTDNFDEFIRPIKSRVAKFSTKHAAENSPKVREVLPQIHGMKTNHYMPNVLAALTVLDILKFDIKKMIPGIPAIPSLKARLELIDEKDGIKIYDDIKSTTPYATLEALKKLGPDTILIAGGETKGMDYGKLSHYVRANVKQTILVKSHLSDVLDRDLPIEKTIVAADLGEAVSIAYSHAGKGDKILLSPAGAYFYSKFVDKKSSFRKLVTSLPPKGQV